MLSNYYLKDHFEGVSNYSAQGMHILLQLRAWKEGWEKELLSQDQICGADLGIACSHLGT